MEGVTHNENSNVWSGDGDQFPKGMRVLVVDDDVTCLHLLEKILQHCSYQVTKCQRGEDALSMIRERKGGFDIVLTDIHMPGMDGVQLLAEIANMGINLPVVLFSSDAEKDTVLKGVRSGACDFLVKPIQIGTLKILWQHVLRSNRRSSNNSSKELETLHSMTTSSSIGTRAQAENEEEENSKGLKRSSEDEADHGQSQSRSKKPRLVWTPELNQMFIMAVNSLGNDDAKPKKILEIMRKMAGVPHLTRQNISSHLQKYRMNSKTICEASEHQSAHSCFLDSPSYANLTHSAAPSSSLIEYQTQPAPLQQPNPIQNYNCQQQVNESGPSYANLTHSAAPSSSLIEYQTQPAPLQQPNPIQNYNCQQQVNELGPSYANLTHSAAPSSSLIEYQSQPAPLQQPNPIQNYNCQQQVNESGPCRLYAHEPFVGFTSPMNNSAHPLRDQTYSMQNMFEDLSFWEDSAFLDGYIYDISAM